MDYDIRSPSNDRIKRLVRLRQQKHRVSESLFPVDELRVFRRALSAGFIPREVYWCPDLIDDPIVARESVISISPEAIARASYRSNPEGIVALFSFLSLDLQEIGLSADPLLLFVEGIEKPGNLGAMLRVADAAGLSGLVVVDGRVDAFNPNVVRASTGALFTVPLARATYEEAMSWLSEKKVASAAAVSSGGVTMWKTDLRGPLALWVGAEAVGLTDRSVAAADRLVTIPMTGEVDSLNASVSAAILVFEALRQRSGFATE